jgi:hypothetical protein
MLPSARRRSAQNCFPREPLDQARAAVVSSALGVTVGSNHAWVWSAQNRLTRVPLGQGRAAVVSSALGVTGGSNHAWVWSAQNRLTLFFATMIGVEAAYFGGGNFFVG